jgi:large subunit ribosomal protein L19e
MTYDLSLQKRLAASASKASSHRITFDPARLNDIKAAITKADIRGLISEGAIMVTPVRGVSRVRARKAAGQRAKGLRKGPGSREGKATANNPAKREWISKVRAQRDFLRELRSKGVIVPDTYRDLYNKSKGGFFRSVRHIKIFINEREMTTRPAKAAPEHASKKTKSE